MSVRSSVRPLLFLLAAPGLFASCANDSDDLACGTPGALASCLSPTQTAEYYAAQGSAYFDTMDSRVELETWPPYSENVARWEWPPWLKLTAWTRPNIEMTDTLLRSFYPSVVSERECRGFDTQPFARCYVVFYYEAHGGRGCPIYEEFFFNEAGEITWIEAWSDVDGLRPMSPEDRWAEAPDFPRLGARIPGLGTPSGRVDPTASLIREAAMTDPDIADFLARTENWLDTWLEESGNAGGDAQWYEGCGWGPVPQ